MKPVSSTKVNGWLSKAIINPILRWIAWDLESLMFHTFFDYKYSSIEVCLEVSQAISSLSVVPVEKTVGVSWAVLFCSLLFLSLQYSFGWFILIWLCRGVVLKHLCPSSLVPRLIVFLQILQVAYASLASFILYNDQIKLLIIKFSWNIKLYVFTINFKYLTIIHTFDTKIFVGIESIIINDNFDIMLLSIL